MHVCVCVSLSILFFLYIYFLSILHYFHIYSIQKYLESASASIPTKHIYIYYFFFFQRFVYTFLCTVLVIEVLFLETICVCSFPYFDRSFSYPGIAQVRSIWSHVLSLSIEKAKEKKNKRNRKSE